MRKGSTRTLLLIVALSLWLVSCAPSEGSSVTGAGGSVGAAEVSAASGASAALPAEVDVHRVAELNAQGEIAVIDVREDWEYAQGHIEGAQLIPLGALASRVDEVPTDLPVVVVCRSGNRSAQAYRLLRDSGFENVSNMTGGMLAWEAAGLDVAR